MTNKKITDVFNKVVLETGSANKYLVASGCDFVYSEIFVKTINFDPPNTTESSRLKLGRRKKHHFNCSICNHPLSNRHWFCPHCKSQLDKSLRFVQTREAKKVEDWLRYHRKTGDIVVCGSNYLNGEWERWYRPFKRMKF